MDSKTLKYWTNAITKGDKTQEDFKEFVVRSQDYNNYVRSMFVDVYYELAPCISGQSDVHVLFEGMMKTKEGSIVSRADIKRYISHTPDFQNGLATEIARLYKTLHGTAPDNANIQGFEEKFLNDPTGTYSLERLEQDIAQQQSNQAGVIADNLDSSTQLTETVTHSPQTAQSQTSASNNDIDIIDLYESVVGRNMSAREFILFARDLNVAKDKAELANKMDDQIRQHFLHVQDIINKFLDTTIDRDAFIARHLIPAFQHDNYGAVLQTDIVISDTYQTKMTDKIKQLHDTMYGEEMVDEDCAYLFNRIRDRQLGILNEDLNRLIAEFKKETDEIVQKVFDIYMEVYEREPEDDELNGHVTFMRMTTDTGIAEATIKKDLRNALEYHDVLKKRIKKVHNAVHGSQAQSISQSHIFKILEKVLAYKDRDDVDTVISQFV